MGSAPLGLGAGSGEVTMQFGLMLRAQFPPGDDMQARFQELLEQARLANALGFDSLTKGMHYSSAPGKASSSFRSCRASWRRRRTFGSTSA